MDYFALAKRQIEQHVKAMGYAQPKPSKGDVLAEAIDNEPVPPKLLKDTEDETEPR